MADLKIIIVDDGANTHSPNPPCVATVEKKKTVSFQNLMNCETVITAEPGLFQGPPISLTLAPGETSRDLRVTGAVASGKEYYYQDCSKLRSPRSGTIDIS